MFKDEARRRNIDDKELIHSKRLESVLHHSP